MAAHPLIQDVPRFRAMITQDSTTASADFTYSNFEEGGQLYTSVMMNDAKLSFDKPRYIAFDAGKNFDAFAGACAHAEIVRDVETGSHRVITVFDWVIRVLPPDGTEVYYDSIFAIIQKLKAKQPINSVEFDHWNATYLVQQIRRLGIRAEEVGMKGDDYRRFRADAYNGLVRMLAPNDRDIDPVSKRWCVDPPVMAPQSCALYELESLEEDPDTQKVYNPRKGQRRGWNSNDTAEVVVHVHKMVQDSHYTASEDEMSRQSSRKRSEGESQTFISAGGGRVFNPSKMMGNKFGGGGRGW